MGNFQPVPHFTATDQTARMTPALDSAEKTDPVRAPAPADGSAAPAAAFGATDETEGLTGLGLAGPVVAHDLQPPKSDRRAQIRYIARWRAAIIDEGIKYMGRTENVSLSGSAVLCDAIVRPVQEVKLYLEVPLNPCHYT